MPALSVKVSVPLIEPVAVGENVTPTVQFAPPAMLVPHVLLAMAKFALTAMLVKLSVALSAFVNVTVFVELVLPAATVPKLRLAAESVTGAPPVPDKLTTCGLVTALSVNVSVPAAEPSDAGVNVTPTVQLAPAPMLAPQVLLAMAKFAVTAMLEKLSATLRRFVNVTVFAALVLPTATVPKLRLAGERETGALPVPARLTVWMPALSVIVSVPDAEPTTVGVNET